MLELVYEQGWSDYEEHNRIEIYEISPDLFRVVHNWHSVYAEPGESEHAEYNVDLQGALNLVDEWEERG